MNASVITRLGCLALVATIRAGAAENSDVGTLLFSTQIPGVVSAAVRLPGKPIPPEMTWNPVDSRMVSQLFAGRVGDTLRPVGAPVPFPDTGAGQTLRFEGFVTNGGVVQVPGTVPGDPVQVKWVAWLRSFGATYFEAMSQGLGYFGESGVVSTMVGGGDRPPGQLTNLQGFHVTTILAVEPATFEDRPPRRVRWSANGHWYQRIEAPLLGWQACSNSASSYEHLGVSGHLVSIGSPEEDAFVSAHPDLGRNSPDWRESWYTDLPPAGPAGLTKGFIVEYEGPFETEPNAEPGPLETLRVVDSDGRRQVLVSWPPGPGDLLQKADPQAFPPTWTTVSIPAGSGASLLTIDFTTSALFRLIRNQ